jgi:S-adenosyl-L-methionine hydrolase (adenosine-forming)
MIPGEKKRPPGIVTLITDFGHRGEYVGAMKGAILSVNPRSQVVDVTHTVGPQNILEAAFVLQHAYPYFPPGTVHLVVVDPGVGTKRRAMVFKKEEHFFVGPDNGVFTLVLADPGKREGYEIARPEFFRFPPSPTFHGRDVFAPVAGHLSLGLDPRLLGPRRRGFTRLDWPVPYLRGGKLTGQVFWADSFGNLVTNIGREKYGRLIKDRPLQIEGRGWKIDRLHQTYGESRAGQPLALFGSAGYLELAVNQGSAREILGLKAGDPVTIHIGGKRK